MNMEHDHDDEGGDDDDDDSLEIPGPVSFCLLTLTTLFCFTNKSVKCNSLRVK